MGKGLQAQVVFQLIVLNKKKLRLAQGKLEFNFFFRALGNTKLNAKTMVSAVFFQVPICKPLRDRVLIKDYY